MNFNAKGEGVYIKMSERKVLVCIRKGGEETHLTYPLSYLVSYRESFFRMLKEF